MLTRRVDEEWEQIQEKAVDPQADLFWWPYLG